METLTAEQFKQKYGNDALSSFAPQQESGYSWKDAGGDISQIGTDIKASVKKQVDFQSQSMDRAAAGQQGALQTTAQDIGSGLGMASSIFGDIFKGVVKLAMPQSWETGIKSGMNAVVTPVMETQIAKNVIQKYNSLDEKTKANITAGIGLGQFALDVATLGTGSKAGVLATEQATKGVIKTGEVVSQIGKDVVDAAGNIIKKGTGIGAKSAEEKALNAITTNIKQLSAQEREDLLKQGLLIPETKLSPAKVILSDAEKAMATKYSSLLQGGTAIENFGKVSEAIVKKSADVEKFLGDTKLVYSAAKLKSQIVNSVKAISKPVGVSDASWNKAVNQLVDDFINSVPKGKTITGLPQVVDLYKARKAFDQTIKNALNAFANEPTAKAELAKQIRNTVQKFIEDQVGDGTYKQAMKDMWELYQLEDIINNKALKDMSYTQIQNWMKSNPVQAKIIRASGGMLRLGTVLGIVN